MAVNLCLACPQWNDDLIDPEIFAFAVTPGQLQERVDMLLRIPLWMSLAHLPDKVDR
jgi:hypothetical protein